MAALLYDHDEVYHFMEEEEIRIKLELNKAFLHLLPVISVKDWALTVSHNARALKFLQRCVFKRFRFG